MQPRKAHQAYEGVATMSGVPLEAVKTINDFYWTRVRQHLSALDCPAVTLVGLGEMRVKHWMLSKEKDRLDSNVKRWLRSYTEESPIFRAFHKDLGLVTTMQEMVATDVARKADNRIKRKEYEEQDNGGLEK